MAKNILVYFGDYELTQLPKGLKYDYENHRWVLELSYIDNRLNENVAKHFLSQKNAEEISDRVSRRVYDYTYKEKTYTEDFFKKEFQINTILRNVEVLRDIMLSDMESVIQSRRDLLMLEHGMDIDKGESIENFFKTLEEHEFSPQTKQIFNRARVFAYLERQNLFVLNQEDIRKDY